MLPAASDVLVGRDVGLGPVLGKRVQPPPERAVHSGSAFAVSAKVATRPATPSARHASRVGAHASIRRSAVCGRVR